MTAQAALRAAGQRLVQAGIGGGAQDARLLLAHAMGLPAERLTLHLQDALEPAALARFEAAISARLARQPVSQIVGHRLFWGRRFKVTRDTLDPRPETEVLVAAALEQPFFNMLDLGTGTGCILLSCLADRPLARGTGTDVSGAALAVAVENAAALGLAARAAFQRADWFAGVDAQYDLIVSNPPYIAAAEMAGLEPEVALWEPQGALTPGGDGLDAYRALAQGAGGCLLAGGRIVLEVGPTQAAAVSALLRAQGFAGLETRRDLDGRDRVVLGRKPRETGSGAAA